MRDPASLLSCFRRYRPNVGQGQTWRVSHRARHTFIDFVLKPHRDASFQKHAGPFLFEFQRHGLPSDEFFSRLAAFFGALPKDFSYLRKV